MPADPADLAAAAFATRIGADGHAPDSGTAVGLARRLRAE